MQTLLNEIELDIRELQCLVQAIAADGNSALRPVARRSIRQLVARLDALEHWLGDEKEEHPQPSEEPPSVNESVPPEPVADEPESAASPIIADRVRPAVDLRRAISVNDSFRFARELFDGDVSRMNDAVSRLGEAASLDEALQLLATYIHHADENNAAYMDFVELLKKYHH